MELLKPQEAARILGVSYPTVKQWIYRRQLKSVRTPGGHHRIPRSEVDRLSGVRGSGTSDEAATPLAAISGRNKLRGIVTRVVVNGLLAQVTLDVGGQSITSIITRTACRELGLKKGVRAIALVKATEVMMIRG